MEIELHQALNPDVGDYWSEMSIPVCVVIEVNKYAVCCLESVIVSKANEGLTFDTSSITVYARDEFSNLYRYGRVDNDDFIATDDPSNIKNKFWASVKPCAFTSKVIDEWMI